MDEESLRCRTSMRKRSRKMAHAVPIVASSDLSCLAVPFPVAARCAGKGTSPKSFCLEGLSAVFADIDVPAPLLWMSDSRKARRDQGGFRNRGPARVVDMGAYVTSPGFSQQAVGTIHGWPLLEVCGVGASSAASALSAHG